MTRINLIDPVFLTDQHLFAEYREITRIPKLVEKSYQTKCIHDIMKKIPPNYRLSTGHVLFFYNKLEFIERRYFDLKNEVLKRGFKITLKDNIIDYRQHIPILFYQPFHPTMIEIDISIQRIIDKILEKPDFYRLYSKKINPSQYIHTLKQLSMNMDIP